MWGRAGRRGRGLAVYIAGEDALDQFFCRHPTSSCAGRSRPRSSIRTAPRSTPSTCICAAHEAPLSDADAPILGEQWRGTPSSSRRPGSCASARRGSCRSRADDYPAARVALRSASARQLRADRRQLGRGARARSRPSARTRPCTPARSTCISGAPTRCSSWTWTSRPGAARAVRRRLLHADQAREHDLHRAPARAARLARGARCRSARSSTQRRCSAISERACRITR